MSLTPWFSCGLWPFATMGWPNKTAAPTPSSRPVGTFFPSGSPEATKPIFEANSDAAAKLSAQNTL
ncbi:hypothetical protein L198_08244 [Cryptococcus wingfieldii CBS 7118]|uniref:Uncharacterized protein n=1 Tax=Cryptococcus wingfieldii CBS 7118 TaxID=1295528 RepID=A0A1E3HD54_9TREE|nr:hypothetical protein L198_08244 [Cryptococcus wingfieldii CBS 7118]ODN74279.1 hypothetical protein L198_08244 [Cryptococcus wingfieldii CBS 7118]